MLWGNLGGGMMERSLYTISQAAAELGIHPDTLRAWTDKALVPVTRLPSGYRRYSREQIDQIKRDMLRVKRAA